MSRLRLTKKLFAVTCPKCARQIIVLGNGTLKRHTNRVRRHCHGSGVKAPSTRRVLAGFVAVTS